MKIGNTYPALGRQWFQAPSEVAGRSVSGQENALRLSISRLNRIRKIDVSTCTATVDAGALREAVRERIQANGPILSLDVSLPLSHLPEFLDRAALIAQTARLRPMLVAHLGDGNLHYAVIAQQGHTWDDLYVEGFARDLTDLLIEFGGSFSAEHGIGRRKAVTLAAKKDPAQLDMMRTIKRAIDPAGLLNPDVLFAHG